jgi:DNA-binding NarL/FixJ family response regulator
MSEVIQIVIADDHPLFREGVAATLQSESDIKIIGEASSADEALKLATRLLPDIVLLDITMPGGGLNAARAIAAACPVTKIIMLTFSEEEDDVLTALKAGARGYILKGVTGRDLRGIVRMVYRGEVYITPSLAAGMLRELAAPPDQLASLNPLEELTEREREILELVSSGKTNKAIGAALGITEKTVKHYMSNILQKLQVRNRVEAALLANKHMR